MGVLTYTIVAVSVAYTVNRVGCNFRYALLCV